VIWELGTTPVVPQIRKWLRGVDLNHRPLGYEPSRISDSNVFQRLDAAGNDTKSLKRHESTVIGPQSDHNFGINLWFLERRFFRVALTSVYNDLTGLRWLRKYLGGRGRRTYLGLDSWADGRRSQSINARQSADLLGLKNRRLTAGRHTLEPMYSQ
jgi:hypothetical protein